MSETVWFSLAMMAWLMCGGAAYVIDRRDYPEAVCTSGDALLSTVLLLLGPVGLAVILFMRTKP